MLANYLKITLRNLWKNKLFVLINIVGLGTALACCIVAYLNWQFNAQFDNNHINAEEIYRVNFVRITSERPINNGSCPAPLGGVIAENMPEVSDVMRYYPTGGNFKRGDDVFRTSICAVDPAFFQAFTFEMIHGNPDQLSDQRAIYISERLADRHFPNLSNPVGETLTYLSGDTQIDFRVAGVFAQPPMNSSFQEQSYVHYDNARDIDDWNTDNWASFNTTFVRIPDPSAVEGVERRLQDYVAVQNEVKKDYKVHEYYLDPFAGMAVRSEREDNWNNWTNDSLPTPAAVAPGIMALLLLLLACFNFTNTSIAIANRRVKEIGVRKVLGSSKQQLIMQFLGENIILSFIALLFGIALAAFMVPAYSAMWQFLDIEFNLIKNPELIAFMLILLTFTGIIAGSYPAFYVSRFQATTIFRGTVKFSGTNLFTRILLTLQFGISMIAIVSGVLFTMNARYQSDYDMGFDMDAVITAWVDDESGYTRFRNALADQTSINAIAGSRHSLVRSWYMDPIKYDSREIDVRIFDVSPGYIKTVGATLVDGRDFKENSGVDMESSVIVNEELVRTYGWDNAINKRIVLRDTIALNVIGVVKDIFYDGALWMPMQPMMLRMTGPEGYRFLTVNTTHDNLLKVQKTMQDEWKVVFPDRLSTVQTMDQERANMVEVNTNIQTMFLFLGLVAVILSAIGLFSLVSLNLNKRMKEIGIRKVLGASMPQITAKMSREFFIILIISSVLGSVAGYYLTEMLMASIWAYYVPASPLVFVLAIGTLLAIGALTIIGKVIKAATVNPAMILQDE